MASKKLKLGDIVFCQRSNFFFGDVYQHYGVYAGYHKIIHYVVHKKQYHLILTFVTEILYILLRTIVYYLFSKMQM